jgi:hypothetical protein
MQKQRQENVQVRRKFLKKALYATPTVVALGSLIKPKRAKADGFGPSPSDPNTNE